MSNGDYVFHSPYVILVSCFCEKMLHLLLLVGIFLLLCFIVLLLLEMNNQDRRGTHTQTQGNEGDHGVHACHNRGRPFPIRHSSSKQRHVNNCSCGTVEGSNPSDDEHLSDDDPHSQGNTDNKGKENPGARENLTRSCDDLFLDATANFSDSAPSSGSMEPLQDSFYSATDVEIGPVCDNRADDVALPQNECEDFKDHKGVTPQNSLSIPSSDPLKPKQDDLKDSDCDDEDDYVFVDRVPDCTMETLESWELVDKESIESDELSDETGGIMYGLKFEIDWNYMNRFSEERGSDDARESSQQISLRTTETTGGISLDNNECADKSPLSGAQEHNEINRSSRVNKECDISTSADSHQTQGAKLLQKAEDDSFAEDTQRDGFLVECSHAIRESLEGNRGSVTGLPSNLNGLNQQHSSSSSSEAGGFPSLPPPQVTNESQGSMMAEEIIAEMTDGWISQPHSPLQSLLSEGGYSSNDSESSADEAVREESGNGSNSPADINSENKKVKRRFHWASYLCCCFCVD